MEATEHSFITPRTARFFQLGDADRPKRIWFVLHGYGQLAQYFIRHFGPAASQGDLIIAPEGLSRYYLDGNFGRVGASWMTKEDRLNEIKDYLTYLNGLADSILQNYSGQSPRVIVMGFSQGCATAIRWVKNGHIRPDNVILWAGDLPPETDMVMEQIPQNRIWLSYGDQDPYFTEELLTERMGKLKAKYPAVNIFRFQGKHQIPEEAFSQFIHQLSPKEA